MALLTGDAELHKFCRQDRVLRYLVFQSNLSCAFDCIKDIVSSREVFNGASQLYKELRKLEGAPDIPVPLQKLLSNTKNDFLNEQLLRSLIYSRVHKLGKLESLNTKLLRKQGQGTPTRIPIQSELATPKRRSMEPGLLQREKLSFEAAVVSAFDPLYDEPNPATPLTEIKSASLQDDLIWFSPASRHSASCNSKRGSAKQGKQLKRAKSQDMLFF